MSWAAATQASGYQIQIATDAGFSNIVYTGTSATNSLVVGTALNSSTQYYWRVTAQNECGNTVASAIFSFSTLPLPGDCSLGSTAQNAYSTDFEGDNSGWTSSGTQNTWAETSTNPHSGTKAFLAADLASASDQRLVSPAVVLPTGQTAVVAMTARFSKSRLTAALYGPRSPMPICWLASIKVPSVRRSAIRWPV